MAARAGNEWIDRLIAKASTQDIQRLKRPTDAVIVGELRLVAGEVDSAVAAMRTCIALGQKEVYLYKSLGWALLAQGEHDEAKQAFQLALKSRRMADGTFKLEGADPDSVTAAYFLDLVTKDEYVDRFKDDKKLACFPWFYIGQRKEIEGDKPGAIAAYEKCVEAGSRDCPHSPRAGPMAFA